MEGSLGFIYIYNYTTTWALTIRINPSTLNPVPTTQGIRYPLFISGNGKVLALSFVAAVVANACVYILTLSTSGWTYQSTLKPNNYLGAQSSFGQSAALSYNGNICVIGGPGNNGTNLPAIWVFSYNNISNQWSQSTTLYGNTTVELGIGYSLAISLDGNTIISVSTLGIAGGQNVVSFVNSGNTYINTYTLINNPYNNTLFSCATSADGGYTIVGSYTDNSDTGAVWAFI